MLREQEAEAALAVQNRELMEIITALRAELEEAHRRVELAQVHAGSAANADLTQLRNAVARLRTELEEERALREEAVRSALSAAQQEIRQLRTTVGTLHGALEQARFEAEPRVQDAVAGSKAEIAQLRATSSALRAELERIAIVHSREIEGNLLGTPADRDVIVVLPPSYDRERSRRYPVVYALHGYSIGADQWIKEIRLPQTAEGAFAKGTPEMIIVLPSSKNAYNGAFFSNSVATGNFDADIIERA